MAFDLVRNPIHLGLGAAATPQPDFDGMPWYAAYAERHQADGVEGRLVSMHSFSAPWDMWEMHPSGSEVIICVSGILILQQQVDGQVAATRLEPGQYAINEKGVWHTADVEAPTSAVFITAGRGTQHRPR